MTTSPDSEKAPVARDTERPPASEKVPKRWSNWWIAATFALCVAFVFAYGRTFTWLRVQVYRPVGTISMEEARAAQGKTMFFGLPYMFASLLAIVVAPICLILALVYWRRRRRRLKLLLIACFFTAAWISWTIEWARFGKIFHAAFSGVPARAEPLIAAIESYRADRGEYPKSLKELVPDYLEAIPHTGLAGYPEFEYRRARSDTPFKKYRIEINVSRGTLGFDEFYYLPDGDHPDYGYEGALEFFGDWAYFHE